jgi:competence protein ComEA
MAVVGVWPWGWDAKVRTVLIVLTSGLALALAWASKDGEDRPAIPPAPELVVDANSAPAPVLMALPGLGPALTGRIIAARAVAPFRSLDDIDRRVKGIGPVKAAALRPFLRFDPVPTDRP